MTNPELPFDTGPKPPKAGTQAATILGILRARPLCSQEIYDPSGPITHRLAARIHDLRRDGWPISSEPCRRHNHPGAAMTLYTLEVHP